MEEEGGAFARSVEQDSVTSVYVYICIYVSVGGKHLKFPFTRCTQLIRIGV